MEYSKNTQQKALKYNIKPNDVLFCQLVAAGADIAEAFHVTHHQGGQVAPRTYTQARTQANEFFANNPGARILTQSFRRKKPTQTNIDTIQQQEKQEEQQQNIEKNELATRDGLIKFLIENTSKISGKEAVQAAQTLAKIQGFDKPKEEELQEKRVFHLPFKSHCRTCQVMKIFEELTSE